MSANDQVSADQEYAFISERLSNVWTPIQAGLKWFAEIFSAILGGTVWLAIDHHLSKASIATASVMADLLVIGVAIVCAVIVVDNGGTWYKWLKKLDEVSKRASVKMPLPKRRWTLFITEGISCAIMVVACLLFCFFNPLREFQ